MPLVWVVQEPEVSSLALVVELLHYDLKDDLRRQKKMWSYGEVHLFMHAIC